MLVFWLVMATDKSYLFPVFISTLWASFTLLLLVVIFQLKINIITCVALSVSIGAAGDNAIQFLLFNKGSLYHTISEIGEASAETFILMMGIASTLVFSYFQTPRTLALLLIVGIFLMFIGDIWVLNGLLRNKVKKD
jgi:hypothetical protein